MSKAKLKTSGVRNSGPNGDRFWGNGEGPHGGPGQPVDMARLGVWLAVGSLTMIFGALALIYVVRLRDKPNYPFEAPDILWLSTAVLLVSSATCHAALRAIRRGDQAGLQRYIGATLALGLLFVGSQFFAWSQMWSQLIRARESGQPDPFLNLFYVITGVHGMHVLAGLVWIGLVFQLARRSVFMAKRHVAVELSTIYWHFMDVVWIAFFALLMFL